MMYAYFDLAITIPKINSLKIYLKQEGVISGNSEGMQILHTQCNHTVSIMDFFPRPLGLMDSCKVVRLNMEDLILGLAHEICHYFQSEMGFYDTGDQ